MGQQRRCVPVLLTDCMASGPCVHDGHAMTAKVQARPCQRKVAEAPEICLSFE